MRFIASVFALACVFAAAEEVSVLYTLKITSNGANWEMFEDFGEPFDDCMPHFVNDTLIEDQLECVGNYADRVEFEKHGVKIVATEESYALNARPPPGYHSFDELIEAFDEIQADYPGLARVIDLNEEYNTQRTQQGRSIFALKISDNVNEDEDEHNLLVVSNHHARELVTPQIALDTAERILASYKKGDNAEIKAMVDGNQIYIVWNMNPDGLAFVWSNNNMWRKNRRPNAGGSFGVDQNRNYPIGWSMSCAGSTTPTSETYRGTAAASEPETRTLLAFQEDRNFAKVVDYHSFAREVRVPYASCASLPTQINTLMTQRGQAMATPMQYRQVRSCCMGGQIHAAYHNQGSLAFLVETATAFQPPAQTMRQELARVWPGTLQFLSQPIPIVGHVVDAATGQPLPNVLITLPQLRYNLAERFVSSRPHGRIHVWLPVGTWTVVASLQGYQSVTSSVEVRAGQEATLNVRLQRTELATA